MPDRPVSPRQHPDQPDDEDQPAPDQAVGDFGCDGQSDEGGDSDTT